MMELNVFGFGRKKPKEEPVIQLLEGEKCKEYVVNLMQEYFAALDHFQFINATALLKDKRNLAISMPWASLITPLLTLTSCEDTYYSLSFLEPKQLKREALRNMYGQVNGNLQQLLLYDFDHVPASAQSSADSPSTTPSTTSDTPKSTTTITTTPQRPGVDRKRTVTALLSMSGQGDLERGKKGEEKPKDHKAEGFFKSLLKQLGQLLKARTEMIRVYTTLSFVANEPPNYQSVMAAIGKVLEFLRSEKILSHVLLAEIKRNVIAEITALQRLLAAQVALSRYNFLESTMLTFQCKAELDGWRNRIFFPAPEKGGRVIPENRAPTNKSICAIYVWLREFTTATTAKMILYFFNIYKQQEFGKNESGGPRFMDMRSLTSNCHPDYATLFENFAQRTEAYRVCLVYEVPRTPDAAFEFSLNGYAPPKGKDYVPPSGLLSWPCIFSYPPEPPKDHMPNLISIILDNDQLLNQYKQPLYYFDQVIGYTYFLIKVDLNVTVIAIYKDKQKANDPVIRASLNTIADHLRNIVIFAKLKP